MWCVARFGTVCTNFTTKSNTPPWVFFTIFKWYQITQNITYFLAPKPISTLLGSHQIFESFKSSFHNLEVVLSSVITSCFIYLEYKEDKTCTSSPFLNRITESGDWDFRRSKSTKYVTEVKDIIFGTVRGS